MAEWTTKYGLGDKVFVSQRKVDEKPCAECNGTGQVPYKDKRTACPDCGNECIITNIYYVPIEVVINYVAFQALVDRKEVKYGFKDSWENLLEGKVFSTKEECLESMKEQDND